MVFTSWKAFKQMFSAGSRIAYFFKDENIHSYLLFSIANLIFFFCIFKEEEETIKSNVLQLPFASTYAKCHSSVLKAYLYFPIRVSTYHLKSCKISFCSCISETSLASSFSFFPFTAYPEISIKDHF